MSRNSETRDTAIRPEQHSLDVDIVDVARKTYGELAPQIRELQCVLPGNLMAFEMERLMGVPLSEVQVEAAVWERQVILQLGLSPQTSPKILGTQHGGPPSPSELTHGLFIRYIRADTPTEGLWLEQHCTGRVGREIIPKLRKLAEHLPDDFLRARARSTLRDLLATTQYPVALNHGDLIPSNVLVDRESWEVTGLVDWAEAEWLPFGTCIYGLEHLLGCLEIRENSKPWWNYRSGSDRLREVFWDVLECEKPELVGNLEEVRVMRDVGVLLWYGYAWDEGRIDRVVNEVNDMAPTTPANSTELPVTEGLITPEHSETHNEDLPTLTHEEDLEKLAMTRKVPPTKLKLKLRSMPSKTIMTAVASRRPGRTSKKTMEHAKQSATNDTLATMPTGVQALMTPPDGLLTRIEAPQPPPRSMDSDTQHPVKGDLFNVACSGFAPDRGSTLANVEPGTANDPIDVDALRSPSSHKFIGQPANYFAPLPLRYRPLRPKLPPTLRTPNGAEILAGRISGHESHDIYKMFLAGKEAPAPPGFRKSCVNLSAEITAGNSRLSEVPHGTNAYPVNVNRYTHANSHMSHQLYTAPLQPGYQSYLHDYRNHTSSYHTLVDGYPIYPVFNEEHLRQKAVQFVLDYTRPRPRKRRLSDDLDDTSNSEYEDAAQDHKKKLRSCTSTSRPETPEELPYASTGSTPSTSTSEDDIFDRNLRLSELVEHMQLLTGLLMTYPRSATQTDLRADIAMLSSVVEKRLENWISAENEFDLDTRKRILHSALVSKPASTLPKEGAAKFKQPAIPGRRQRAYLSKKEVEERKKKEREDEVRKYLSADSSIWEREGMQRSAEQDAGRPDGKDCEHDGNDAVLGLPRDGGAASRGTVMSSEHVKGW
ncbi:hypothetical protein N0V90_009637 [Kalmusia sp. IMI 367209]|nr:hypothetical protein N0V90_009637 [Kalmusia sp. IMI 367209]